MSILATSFSAAPSTKLLNTSPYNRFEIAYDFRRINVANHALINRATHDIDKEWLHSIETGDQQQERGRVSKRIVRHPEVLQRLEETVAARDDTDLDAVIKETMRVRPAVPITARCAIQPFELDGLAVQPGMFIVPFNCTISINDGSRRKDRALTDRLGSSGGSGRHA